MKIDLETIKARIDCADLLASRGIEWSGRDICCPLPGHDDSRPSFGLTEDRQAFKCHGCQRKGDVFELFAELTGNSFKDCSRVLAGMANVEADAKPKPKKKQPTIHATADAAISALAWGLSKSKGEPYIEARRDPYASEVGDTIAYMVRFNNGNGGKEYRPIMRVDGGWVAKSPSQWPLFNLTAILTRKETVYVCEGEKAASAGSALGLVCTTSAHGAQSPNKTDWRPLINHDVVILPDNDESGMQYAQTVAGLLDGIGTSSIKIVELAGVPEKGDLVEWVEGGGTAEKLGTMAKHALQWEPAPTDDQKPCVLLPGGSRTISSTASELGHLLGQMHQFFVRGGLLVKMVRDSEGKPILEALKPSALASDFEAVAILQKWTKDGPKADNCGEQAAKLIAASGAFRSELPKINLLSGCPVLIERGGELVQVHDYDRESGILAAGEEAQLMPVAEAVAILRQLIADYKFATPADGARALAALITPAMLFGGLLRGRAPVDLSEANASQTGKGYRNKILAALYSNTVRVITQKKNGVGGLEESFDAAIIRGASFIVFDNVRGKIDSPKIESFMTEENYSARIPFSPDVEIDPRRIMVMMTSNKADVTTDMANRSSCVRILKQDDGFEFTEYHEGDILDHIRANQPRFLGAVFSVIKAWFDAGKPRTKETRHDFRPWAQNLDWISQNILGAGPLLDGHRETQQRITNPFLGWLRDVAIEVIRVERGWETLHAGDVVDIIAESSVEVPGVNDDDDLTDFDIQKKARQGVGRKMGRCFKNGSIVLIDGMKIERTTTFDPVHRKDSKAYVFTPAPNDDGIGAKTKDKAETETKNEDEGGDSQPHEPICAYNEPICAYSAPNSKNPIGADCNPPNDSDLGEQNQTVAPNAPMVSSNENYTESDSDLFSIRPTMQTDRRNRRNKVTRDDLTECLLTYASESKSEQE